MIYEQGTLGNETGTAHLPSSLKPRPTIVFDAFAATSLLSSLGGAMLLGKREVGLRLLSAACGLGKCALTASRRQRRVRGREKSRIMMILRQLVVRMGLR